MQTVEYSLDDIGQISFEPIENLDAELIQCDISFGLTKKKDSTVTSKDVDLALKTKISIRKRKINFISVNLFLNRLKLDRLKAICGDSSMNKKTYGFPDFALIIEFKGFYLSNMYLIIKRYNENEKILMTDAIASISKKFNLFLVDNEIGCVIESKDKKHLEHYLTFDQ